MIIGGIVVLLVIVVAAAYLLMGSYNQKGSYSTTIVTSVYSTTTQGSTIAPTTTAAGAPSTTVSAVYTVNLENSASVGYYIGNETGYTLYTYGSDVANSGASTCYSSCAANWPPFYPANLSVAPGLNPADFGTIVRTGGAMQLTYKGRPLYLFIADRAPGDINGNGVNNFNVATVTASVGG